MTTFYETLLTLWVELIEIKNNGFHVKKNCLFIITNCPYQAGIQISQKFMSRLHLIPSRHDKAFSVTFRKK